MKVPWISKEQIALKAMRLLENFEAIAGYIIKPPIPVEDIIERGLGLRLLYADLQKILGKDDVLGATYVDKKLICINERLFENSSEGRLAFTCAHEAGHWVLHLPYAEVRNSESSKSGTIVCKLKDAREPVEWQADYFASCLLMPERMVMDAFQRICSLEPIVIKNVRSAAQKGSRCDEPFIEQWPYIAAAMCEAGGFSNVSWQAMIIRLQDLELLINKTGIRMDWEALCSNW